MHSPALFFYWCFLHQVSNLSCSNCVAIFLWLIDVKLKALLIQLHGVISFIWSQNVAVTFLRLGSWRFIWSGSATWRSFFFNLKTILGLKLRLNIEPETILLSSYPVDINNSFLFGEITVAAVAYCFKILLLYLFVDILKKSFFYLSSLLCIIICIDNWEYFKRLLTFLIISSIGFRNFVVLIIRGFSMW